MPAFFAIVAGKDEYLVERDARALYDQAVKQAGADADKEIISGLIARVDDARPIEIQFLESINTLSMFGGAKVVWLRNLNWIADSVPARSEDVKESTAKVLAGAAACVGPVSVIISCTPYDGRRKDLAAYKSQAQEFIIHAAASKSPFSKEDPQADMQIALVEKVFKDAGVKHARGVPEAIVGRVGQSTRVVLMEAEKLAVYAGPGGSIKESEVHFLVPTFGEGDFFEPIEAFAERDLAWGLESLDRYFFNESSCRPLLSALQSRLRLLIQIRSLADSGEFRVAPAGLPKGAIETASMRHGSTFGSAAKSSANVFSQNPWYVSNKVAPAAARYTLAELIDAQLGCAECFDAANSGADEEVAVRALFLRVLAVRR
jgi:DNA polymerase-3 subunit delta